MTVRFISLGSLQTHRRGSPVANHSPINQSESVDQFLPKDVDGLSRLWLLSLLHLLLVLKVQLIDVHSVVLSDAVLHDLDHTP